MLLLVLLHGVETPVAHSHGDAMLAAVILQEGRDVESIVDDALAIVGRGRSHYDVAEAREIIFRAFGDEVSVDVCLVESQSADMQRGAFHLRSQREGAAEIACGESGMLVLTIPRIGMLHSNPVAFPSVFLHESHAPRRGCAPFSPCFFRFLAIDGRRIGIFSPHLPPIFGIRRELLATEWNPLGLIGNRGMVPDIAFIL